jgi:hypothetical protein
MGFSTCSARVAAPLAAASPASCACLPPVQLCMPCMWLAHMHGVLLLGLDVAVWLAVHGHSKPAPPHSCCAHAHACVTALIVRGAR